MKNDAKSMFISGKLVKNVRCSREISENFTFNTEKFYDYKKEEHGKIKKR